MLVFPTVWKALRWVLPGEGKLSTVYTDELARDMCDSATTRSCFYLYQHTHPAHIRWMLIRNQTCLLGVMFSQNRDFIPASTISFIASGSAQARFIDLG